MPSQVEAKFATSRRHGGYDYVSSDGRRFPESASPRAFRRAAYGAQMSVLCSRADFDDSSDFWAKTGGGGGM
ncbi:hypothetical protein MRX96_027112 [Rhipicephalus microplus]